MTYRLKSLFYVTLVAALLSVFWIAMNKVEPEVEIAMRLAAEQGVEFLPEIEIPKNRRTLRDVNFYNVGDALPKSEAYNFCTLSIFTAKGWSIIHSGREPNLPKYIAKAFKGEIATVRIATDSEIRMALKEFYGPERQGSYDGPLDYFTDTFVGIRDFDD